MRTPRHEGTAACRGRRFSVKKYVTHEGNRLTTVQGDLAGILTLAASRKTPADPGDGRVLTSLAAGGTQPSSAAGPFPSGGIKRQSNP